jgi:hypothetical protein
MRKVTLAVAALTLLVAGFVLAQVTTAKTPVITMVGENEVKPVENIQLSQNLRLRIEGQHDGRVIGTLMANVDGQWVEVVLASKNMRALSR